MEQTKKCPSCGGTMIFQPGFNNLLCQSCGHKEIIPELVSKIPVNEPRLPKTLHQVQVVGADLGDLLPVLVGDGTVALLPAVQRIAHAPQRGGEAGNANVFYFDHICSPPV